MNATQATDANNLLSLNPQTLEVPKSRLQSAKHARDIFNQDVQNYSKRSQRNAQVSGLVDGNPPFMQSELTKQGQSWRSNFNTGEGKGFFDVALSAFYDVVSAGESKARVQCTDQKPEAGEWGNILTHHFNWLLEEFEDSLDALFQTTQHDMVLYSMGPVVWDDEVNWLPKRVKFRLLRLPDECPSEVDEWPRCTIEYNFGVGELYRYISDEKVAKDAGWDVMAVKKAIVDTACASDPSYAGQNRWEIWQERLNQNDIYWNSRLNRVRVARLLYKEFADEDGLERISDAWVAVNASTDTFLFKKERRFDYFHEVICPFFYERGDGTANGIKGLGVRMFGLLTQNMRLLNAAVDATYNSMTTLVQPVGAGSNTNLPIISRGPWTILPSGFNFIQRQVSGVMDAPMMMRSELANTLQSNLANYRQRINEKEGNPRTKFELETLVMQNSVLSATQLARYFKQLDAFFAEMFRRAALAPITGIKGKWADKAREFRRRCKEDGLPESCYKNVRVTAVRPVGAGNPQQRFQSLMAMRNLLGPTMSAQGLESLDRDIANTLGGGDSVRRYLPPPEAQNVDQENLWQAQSENNDFTIGGNMPVIDGQDDVIHLTTHLEFANQVASSIEGGADPFKIYATLESLGKHCAAHIIRLSKNPLKQAQFKELEARFRELAKATDNLRKKLEDMQRQQQEQAMMQAEAQEVQQGLDPETQIKMAKAQNDMAIKNAKAEQQMALKRASAQQNMVLKDASTAQNMALQQAQQMTPTPSMSATALPQ